MEFSRQEYPAILDTLQPAQAVATLNERVKRVGKLNSEVADWLQERRKVEEAYVQGLKKLARKQPPDESSELGVFSVPWTKIVSSTEAIAASHHVLAGKIEIDVELPLREFTTKNRDMQTMSTIQGNLAAMAKEIDAAQDKADKLKKRGGKASAEKVANASSDVENAQSQWSSQAPFVFEKLQALDESRLNHLRDVLTQFQTHEVDQVERSRVTAEDCLNALLNVETVDEIKTFAARAVSGRPRLERKRSRTIMGSSTSTSLAPPNFQTSDAEIAPTPQSLEPDAASQRSGASGGAVRANTPKESRHGGLSSLKRLGTVISRRRQSAIPPYGRTPSPGKQSTDRFGGFGRSSRDAPPVPSPRNSSVNVTGSPTQEERSSSFPSDALSPLEARQNSRDITNGEIRESQSGHPNNLLSVNGPRIFEGNQGSPTIQQPASTAAREPTYGDQSNAPSPPQVSASEAMAQAQAEAANQQPQFKLDIRNDPIQEEDGDAETALAHVANTLRAQAAQPPSRKAGTVRGRREVRNTVFVPSPPTPEVAGTESANHNSSPFRPGKAVVFAPEDHAGSDTQSVRSSRSLSTIASAIVRHPDMHEPGLNCSVVETVSAWFEHGQIVKGTVIGELALQYHPPSSISTATTEAIRLENFQALEKVAPNPTFISQIPEKPGEYDVNLSHLSKTTVAFKYKVHLEDTALSTHAPLIIIPSWKIEPKQTSVILSYALNPTFGSGSIKNTILHEVVFIIHVEGTKPSSCQSKPVGNFSKEKSLIYWRVGEVKLSADTAPTKLLARFTTEEEAKPGNVEARWEISGEHATGIGSGLNVSQISPTSAAPTTSVPGPDADPFADERAVPSPGFGWKEVPSMRRVVSGKYSAL